jgi:uncharacterized protein (TIGR02145 family)
MPIHISTSTKDQQQISFNGKNMQRVYVGDKLVWQKILASLGYGRLYNWWCTQLQFSSANNGYFYNFYAATDSRKITSSEEWIVPDYTDFTTLITYLGGASVSGGKLKSTASTHWNSPNTGATNEVNFNLYGTGTRNNSVFGALLSTTRMWTTYSTSSSTGYAYEANYNNATLAGVASGKTNGNSIRLVRTSTTLTHGQTGIYVVMMGVHTKLFV